MVDSKQQPEKVLLVTGASRGIGAAIALQAAARNYAVVVNYINHRDQADEVVRQIEERGGNATAIQADVSSTNDVEALFSSIDSTFGQLDALVNNAGILAPLARVEDMTADRIQELFSVNVVGSFLCAREAVRRMSTKNGGSGGAIVNISSGAARLGGANDYVDYAATKGAIDTFTIGLAKEVAGENIRVNAVRPGFIETDMHDLLGMDSKWRFEQVKPTIPLARIGSAEEVANAVLWLLSDEASYCTGAIFDITGGR